MKFLVDGQLPPALARWIASHGHQAAHVFDVGLQTAPDPVIWQYASKSETAIISKDEDFVDRWLVSDTPVRLIWVRKGNCSNEALMAWFEPLWTEALKRLERGERFVELQA